MKKLILVLVAIFSLAVAPAGVFAQAETDSPTTRIYNLRKNIETTLEKRTEKYKTTLGRQLSNAEQTLLKDRCKAAQTKIETYLNSSSSLESNRANIYATTDTKLDILANDLQSKGLTTEAVEVIAAQKILQQKTDAVLAGIQDYRQALKDAQEIDCQADPTAFRAALETARTARTDLFTRAQEVRKYVKETLNELLKNIKVAVE